MKKILSLLLIFVLVFSVVACKKADQGSAGMETVISKTKEGAVANSLMINSIDISKSEVSAEFKLELKPGLVSLIPNLPIQNKEALEKMLMNIVGKMGFKMNSVSDVSNGFDVKTGTKITYGGKDLIDLNVKFNGNKYYYYIPQMVDKTIVFKLDDLMGPSELPKNEKAMDAMKAILDVKNNDKKVNAALKAVAKDVAAEFEKVFAEKSIVSDPEDVEIELKSGKAKLKKYSMNIKLSELSDVMFEAIKSLKAKPEFKTNVMTLVDSVKVAFDKDDKFKTFYEDEKQATKENFEKDFNEFKTSLEDFFKDEKALDKAKVQLDEMKESLTQIDSVFKLDLSVYLDDKQISRAQEINIDSPFAKVNMMSKLEAINDAVKDSAVAFGKEEIEVKSREMKELDGLKDEAKANLIKLVDGDAVKELIKDVQEGAKAFEGQDKALVDQLIKFLDPEQLKALINGL